MLFLCIHLEVFSYIEGAYEGFSSNLFGIVPPIDSLFNVCVTFRTSPVLARLYLLAFLGGPKVNKEFKTFLSGAFLAACVSVAGGAVHAASISTTDILSNWTAGNDAISGGTDGSWVNSGGNLSGTGNHRGSIISDFTAALDYSFSATSNPGDNDTFSVLFGWTDANNHYRVSWSDDYGESGTEPNTVSFGQAGFRVVKVSSGINTLLYSSGTDYTSANNYSIKVQATSGGGFGVIGRNETTNTVLENQSFTDSTFTSGKVGFNHLYMSNSTWFDVDFTQGTTVPPSAVPLPASLPLLAFGFGAIGLMARRKRKAS